MKKKASDLKNDPQSFDIRPTEAAPKKPKKTKKVLITILVVILVVLTLLSITAVALLSMKPFEDTETGTGDASTEPTSPQSVTEPVTEEFSPSKNTQYFLVCGVDVSQKLTDVIMIVCYQYEENTVSILQVPRDTIVSNEYSDGSSKINSVYDNASDGERKIDNLMDCIYNQFGIKIDHYGLFTIDALRQVVEVIGGVDIENPDDLYVEDADNGGEVLLPAGTVHLDANLAEGFLRCRKAYYQGDIGRLQAQRLFYANFLSKVTQMSTLQVISTVTKVYDEIATDLSVGELIKYATHVRGINLNTISIMILPGQGVTYNGLSCWTTHITPFVEMFNTYFNPEGLEFTEDNVNVPQIQNGYNYDGAGTTLGNIITDGDKIGE